MRALLPARRRPALSRRPAGRRRGVAALAAVVLGLAGLAGCGGDDGGDDGGGARAGDERAADGGATTTSLPGVSTTAEPADLLEPTGGAPAARGSGLDVPPAPAGRRPPEGLGDVDFGEVALAVTAADGEVTGWCVLLALTSDQRQRGLMEVTDLRGYSGMLFVFPTDSPSGFYMRNTPTPLTIGWFDAEGELVSTADMEPCADVDDCPTYSPTGQYRFALEVPQGRLDDLGAGPGSRLAVGGPCAAPT
jgi:uncharacterized membrane protein (UPF0127 family)